MTAQAPTGFRSYTSGGAIPAFALVKLNTTESPRQAVVAGAGDVPIGVNQNYASASGVQINVATGGSCKLIAAGTIARNDLLMCAANGEVVKYTGDVYAEQVFAADANTTITTGGTFQAAEGTATAGSTNTNMFTLTAGDGTTEPRITLSEQNVTGRLVQVVITGSFKFATGSGDGVIQAGIMKNGTVETGGLATVTTSADTLEKPFAVSAIVSLDSDDYIQLGVTSDQNSDVVTVTEANVKVLPVTNDSRLVVGRAEQGAVDNDIFEALLMLN